MIKNLINNIKVDKDVVFTQLSNSEAVLLHIGSKKYFSLNETGIFLWKFLEKGIFISDLILKTRETYEVSKILAEQSINEFVSELISEKLIRIED